MNGIDYTSYGAASKLDEFLKQLAAKDEEIAALKLWIESMHNIIVYNVLGQVDEETAEVLRDMLDVPTA